MPPPPKRPAPVPPPRATKADLVRSLRASCDEYAGNAVIRQAVKNPEINTRSLATDDFAKLMRMRRQQR